MKVNVELDVKWAGEDGIDEGVKDLLVKRIVEALGSKVSNLLEKAAKDKINHGIDSFLDDTMSKFLDRKIVITDRYGDMESSYENVEEMLKEKFDEFISQRVDKKGNPTTSCSFGAESYTRLVHKIENSLSGYSDRFNRMIDKASKEAAQLVEEGLKERHSAEMLKRVTDTLLKNVDTLKG